MPGPYSSILSRAAIVYWDAPGSKTRLSRLTITSALVTLVIPDVPKVAMSVVPFGTVCGLQLAAVFQSPLEALLLHVALPASECPCAAKNSSAAATKNLNLLTGMLINEPVGMLSLDRLRTHRRCSGRCFARASTNTHGRVDRRTGSWI